MLSYDTAKNKSLWEQRTKKVNTSPRCNSIPYVLLDFSPGFYFFDIYLFFLSVYLIPSNPILHTHYAGYWEAEVEVEGGWLLGCRRKITKFKKMFFQIMFMSQAARKKCGLVRGNHLRLWFSMHAGVDRYFLSFWFLKLTLMHPNLGLCAISMWLSATTLLFGLWPLSEASQTSHQPADILYYVNFFFDKSLVNLSLISQSHFRTHEQTCYNHKH